MTESDRSNLDRLLDALADEVAERLQKRAAVSQKPAAPAPQVRADPTAAAPGPTKPAAPAKVDPPPPAVVPAETDAPVPALPSRYAARLMRQLALFTLVGLVLINIPFNRQGLTLATALPDSAALVIRDGLVVKPAGSPDIYVYEDGAFRWISSLDAFEHYGYRWQQVRDVEADFLADYATGAPLHVLLKCDGSPHIYRLENGVKRWIVDIATFTAEGHVWEDVLITSCHDLRNYPNGETIPTGHGPSPEP